MTNPPLYRGHTESGIVILLNEWFDDTSHNVMRLRSIEAGKFVRTNQSNLVSTFLFAYNKVKNRYDNLINLIEIYLRGVLKTIPVFKINNNIAKIIDLDIIFRSIMIYNWVSLDLNRSFRNKIYDVIGISYRNQYLNIKMLYDYLLLYLGKDITGLIFYLLDDYIYLRATNDDINEILKIIPTHHIISNCPLDMSGQPFFHQNK